MENPYQEAQKAESYMEFLASENGQLQKQFLIKALRPRLPKNEKSIILDAGCGSGWLTGELSSTYQNIQACDLSQVLLKFAKEKYPGLEFKHASLLEELPYEKNFFDCVVLNMTGPDLQELYPAFKNLSQILKPGGRLLVTLPHPRFSFPSAVWKRGFVGAVLGRMPKLFFKTPPQAGTQIIRQLGRTKIPSFYWEEKDYMEAAKKAGLKLAFKQEIQSGEDSDNFDLKYQLFRYPLLLLLEFEKLAK